MLLPSALACDSSQPPLTRLQASLLASPPASPPQISTQTAVGNIFSTCRSLHNLLASPAPLAPQPPATIEPITPPTTTHAQLPTPPLAHAPAPLKLRLRSRKNDTPSSSSATDPTTVPPRKRIAKRTPVHPSRGPNKRRRAVDDGLGREEDTSSDVEPEAEEPDEDPTPQTPKRSRIAPEVIPLGLERGDYHSLHHSRLYVDNNPTTSEGTDIVAEGDGSKWSAEDDRILVELVLEKLKLSKSEWQDCARSLGKDRSSVGKRWKSLMVNGDVGLKRTGLRRGRIHGTWR
ncbi:hypothetical protein QC763_112500 [Podospora pseudopauciseta]|uniref:Myb-like domain-containing protein n=2 Tax=Podospora TaxID=5144 RepID=A0ABR0I0K2_9PEZI|nr:hypothetical protein QC763_112500 [Podospora pseudopauciseta]KAK4681993.1 hypothetical protein QC764_112500 [Podospora pseudoanserina]